VKNIRLNSEKISSTIRNGIIQAFIFACIVISYFIVERFTPQTNMVFHSLFYTLNLAIILILFYFNKSKPAFYILCCTIGYIVINFLKNKLGTDYASSAAYQNTCLFLAVNLVFFALLPNLRLLSKRNLGLLILILGQYSLGEHLSRQNISLNISAVPESALSGIAFLLFCLTSLILFVKMTMRGNFYDYGFFFSICCIFLGLENSFSASGLSLFFSGSSLLLLYSLSRSLYIETYKDMLTGFYSRNSYIIQAKKFPLKYSIGLISIDDYDKLERNFGQRAKNTLVKLIARQIGEQEKEEPVFRYADDEFIILFRNADKKETFQRMEAIRRSVAAASFVYHPRRKPIKLTVSGAVSEKKRSDADSFEVLLRAGKTLQKTRSFSHNITSQA